MNIAGTCGMKAPAQPLAATPASASAHEIYFVAPDMSHRSDVYWLHKEVWAQVATRRQALQGHGGRIQSTAKPTLLFRQDGPLVRVRVTGWVLTNSGVGRAAASQGDVVRVRARLGLWRDCTRNIHSRATQTEAQAQVRSILQRSGLRVLHPDECSRASQGLALLRLEGSKWIKAGGARNSAGAHRIEFTAADVELLAEVVDADAVRQAWVQGAGRAKRLGCGMLEITPVAGGLSTDPQKRA